jgi:uncharacterized protein (TIGR02231 family)
MRQLFFVLALLFCTTLTWAAEKEIKSSIKEVTVFRSGAQVTRSAKASIPAGNSILKFTNISANINPQSIQLGAKGNFTLLSVTHQLNYFNEPAPKEQVEALQNERVKLNDQMLEEQAIVQVYSEEESMILANKMIGGQQNGVNIDDLKANADFYRTRLKDIKLTILEQNKKIIKLKEEIAKIDQQLNQLNASRKSGSTSEILVAVRAKTAVDASFLLNYLVYNANWTPSYDLRVDDIDKPVKLDYKANVAQSSGEDWNNVQLSLSTANPQNSGTRPVLNDWWLRFFELTPVATGRRRSLKKESMGESQIYLDGEAIELNEAMQTPSVEIFENTTSKTFKIEDPYDIPSNAKSHVVYIQQQKLPASYEYYAAPKLDPDVFLTALVTDWEQYDLLSGEANLFFEGTYVGKSLLNVDQTQDTLILSLGRDKNITVSREKQKDFSKKQFIGNKKTENIAWKISVRNKKKQAIKLVIEDQYPLSTSSEIEVKLESSKGAKVDEARGRLTWDINLKPGQKKDLEFKYSVKYPKHRQLVLE